jgi:hypothetical protein
MGRGVRAGGVLVVLAGGLLLAATFLPWIEAADLHVGGGPGVSTYSGAALVTECRHREFPGRCVLEDPAISPEFVPHTVATGEWSFLAGAALIALGASLFAMRTRGRRFQCVLAAAWVTTFLAFLGAIWTFVLLAADDNGHPPASQVGIVVAALAPVVGVAGLVTAHVSYAMIGRRTLEDETRHSCSTSASRLTT